MKLPIETFKTIIESTPLVSIDLLVRNKAGEVLLGERLNRPAQCFWFVPGGRILKDEPMSQAFTSLVKEELGVKMQLQQANFLGPFEHFYDDNVTGTDFSTHYVVLGYEITVDVELGELPCEQHGNYRWFSETEMLAAENVHRHSKWYLDRTK